MKALPGPLAAWSEQLSALNSEARELFGVWLPTLDRLLGPHPLDRPDQAGEPDGLSGLGRRGRYERLALSEWGLLDVAPEEFLRRTGSGEHLFLQIARRASAGAGRLVVLFDAGPLQLGAPRLAHLAWLLVLSRRAARVGARLMWGIAQVPDQLHQGVDLRMLLAGRSPRLASAEERSSWSAKLGPAPEGEERWLVSAGADPRWEEALGAGTLVVAEPDEPGEPTLRVEARQAGSRHRAMLRLPATETCARLVRDALAGDSPEATSGRSLERGAQFTFSATGSHVLARMTSGEIVALAARGPAPAGPMARFRPGQDEQVVAAGWRKGRMYVATVHDKGIRLHVGRGGRWQHTGREVMGNAPLPRPSGMLLASLAVDIASGAFWFGDGGWRLYHGFTTGGYVFTVPETVLGWIWSHGRVLTIGRVGSGPLELFTHRRGGLDRVQLNARAGDASEAYLCLDVQGKGQFVMYAGSDRRWYREHLDAPQTEVVDLPESAEVCGAVRWQGRPACLVLSRSGAILELISTARRHVLVGQGPIEHAQVQPGGALLAAQIRGQLRVFDTSGKDRLVWGERRP